MNNDLLEKIKKCDNELEKKDLIIEYQDRLSFSSSIYLIHNYIEDSQLKLSLFEHVVAKNIIKVGPRGIVNFIISEEYDLSFSEIVDLANILVNIVPINLYAADKVWKYISTFTEQAPVTRESIINKLKNIDYNSNIEKFIEINDNIDGCINDDEKKKEVIIENKNYLSSSDIFILIKTKIVNEQIKKELIIYCQDKLERDDIFDLIQKYISNKLILKELIIACQKRLLSEDIFQLINFKSFDEQTLKELIIVCQKRLLPKDIFNLIECNDFDKQTRKELIMACRTKIKPSNLYELIEDYWSDKQTQIELIIACQDILGSKYCFELIKYNNFGKTEIIELLEQCLNTLRQNGGWLGNAIGLIQTKNIRNKFIIDNIDYLEAKGIENIINALHKDKDKTELIDKYIDILKQDAVCFIYAIASIEEKEIIDKYVNSNIDYFTPSIIGNTVFALLRVEDKMRLFDTYIDILKQDAASFGKAIGSIKDKEVRNNYIYNNIEFLGPIGIVSVINTLQTDNDKKELFEQYYDMLLEDSNYLDASIIGIPYETLLESITIDRPKVLKKEFLSHETKSFEIQDDDRIKPVPVSSKRVNESQDYGRLVSDDIIFEESTTETKSGVSVPEDSSDEEIVFATAHETEVFEMLDETQTKPVQLSWTRDNELQSDEITTSYQASDYSTIDEFFDDNENNPSIEESVEQKQTDSQQEEDLITRIKSVFANIFIDTKEELTTETKSGVIAPEELSDEEIVFAQAQPKQKTAIPQDISFETKIKAFFVDLLKDKNISGNETSESAEIMYEEELTTETKSGVIAPEELSDEEIVFAQAQPIQKTSLPQIKASELFSGIEKAKKDSKGLLLSSEDLLTGYYLFEEETSKDEENREELLYPTYDEGDFYPDEESSDDYEIVSEEGDIDLPVDNQENFFQTIKRKFNMFILHKDVPEEYDETYYDPIFGSSRNSDFVFPPSDEDDYEEEIIIDKSLTSDEQDSDKLKSELYQKFVNAWNNRIISLEDIKKKSCLPTKINSIIDKVKSLFAGKPTIEERTDKIFKIVRARKPKNKLVLSKKVVTVSLTLALILSSTAIALTHNFNANKVEVESQPTLTANDVISACDLARDDTLNKLIMERQTEKNISFDEQKIEHIEQKEQNNESEKKNDSAQVDNKQEEEIIINIGDIVTVDADYIYTDVYKAKDKVDGEKPYFENNKERNVKGILFTLDGDNVYCTTRDEIKNTFDAGGIAQSYVVGDENGYEGAYNAEDVVFVESADGYGFVKSDDAKVLYRV